MKKLLALLLSALMLIGMLTACGDDISKGDTELPAGTQGGKEDTPVSGFTSGTVILNAVAVFEITFDKETLVTGIAGMNEYYKEFQDFLGEDSQYLGLNCDEVIAEMIKSIAVKGYLKDSGYVVIKQSPDGALPNENFLKKLQSSAESALKTTAAEVPLVMITAEQQDANGRLDMATAKVLVEKFLGVEALTVFDGTANAEGGIYGIVAGEDGTEEYLLVNAVTGEVDYGILDEMFTDPEATEETLDDTYVPEDTQATGEPEDDQPVAELPEDTSSDPAVNEG